MDYTKEIEKASKHPNVVKFMSQNGGSLASSDLQMKKGTMILEFKDGYQWVAYANGYLRETNAGAGSDLKVITKPQDGYDYDSMGLDFYTDYAIEKFQERIDKRIKNGKKKLKEMLNRGFDLIVVLIIESKYLNSEELVDTLLNPDYQYLKVSTFYSRYFKNIKIEDFLESKTDYAGNSISPDSKTSKSLKKIIEKADLNVKSRDAKRLIKIILP